MDVFKLREELIAAYRDYATSFMRIRDQRITAHVNTALDESRLWPHPQVGLNPSFHPGGTVEDLVANGLLHPRSSAIFRAGKSASDAMGRPMTLHQHQVDAIRAARDGRSYVLTTGTGSGKSLGYIIPIVDHVLRHGSGGGVTAVVVYPMNALANSQAEELAKFLDHGPWTTPPVTYARYTGQEGEERRQEILNSPPDIILTNYVMLELILTRYRDRRLVSKLGDLRFLVLDELHTYRGRQGADVALLVRRLREASGSSSLLCVGTSATLSSQGTFAERQAKVGEVASLLFGAEVRPPEVINETLERATADDDLDDPAFVDRLRRRIERREAPPSGYADFVADPLSVWIEGTFGLRAEDGRLTRAAPLPLEGLDGGAARLAGVTGCDLLACRDSIKAQLMAGYAVNNPANGFPAFAFRLHQFLSRGDTVYTSPEPAGRRYITLDPQRFVPGNRERILLPVAFCRACGQDYYVASRAEAGAGEMLVPRDLGDTQGERGDKPGFLYLSDDPPWPNDETYLERLPEDWLDENGSLLPARRADRPTRITVASDGAINGSRTGAEAPATGWWLRTPFRFCLACGASYAGRLGRDFARLTTLGSEGRSTATTIMSLGAIRSLRADRSLPRHARKLLSFTDNRQDASLQAGHFNDFVGVTTLRAALWRALHEAGAGGLAHDELAKAAFEMLHLPAETYARDPGLKGAARSDTDRVMREVLAYRLYRDQVRGWRLTQPNLEQTGLLRVEYESLDELAADPSEWAASHDALAGSTSVLREHVLRVLLDTARRDLAINVDVLDQNFQEGLRQRASQRLAGAWSLEDERLEYATELVPRSKVRHDNREWMYLSSRGGYGQFLRRRTVLGAEQRLKLTDTTVIIGQLCQALRSYGLLIETGETGDGIPRYQVPASAMRWVVGDGTRPYHDHIRMPNAPEETVEANSYFVSLYRSVGEELHGIEAREHTAQVPYAERLDREERFREGELDVLYCSPTMELGVDISQLNVVNLRNVPPTPANYAQRSGRAGRSGQPALVFTYCAALSSHDQHFFRQPQKMVAGQVEPPRLDLANEDLVRAHVQAVWLAESGLDLGSSMKDILELADDEDAPKVKLSIQAHLDEATAKARAKERAKAVLGDLNGVLGEASWWSDEWLTATLQAVPVRFEQALARWQALYRAALQQAREQSKIKQSAGRSAGDRQQADRLRREAENQLEILRAESDSRSQSDFYTYRYFAAEGFLPGYSFPRLPLSAFIPGRQGRRDVPEFLQRPRFLAISEFGPQSLIYHEGARYRINRVILPVGDLDAGNGALITTEAKRCESCGYLHPVPTPPGPDNCERCRALLPSAMTNLFRLQNVSTVRRDRITSDEEERQRKGYEVISGVHFARRQGQLSVREATVSAGDEPILHLAYGDTATIWRVNLGWRRRKVKEQHGFLLDLERGYWGKDEDDPDASADPQDPMSKRIQRVVPYVEDTRNALLITPAQPLEAAQMASLQAALKVAFEVTFQLEESELAAEPLPSVDQRNLLVFYESAEGGAGVLRRLLDEPELWQRVAREALRRCHLDPDSLADFDDTTRRVSPCEAACYDCLLSYRNQTDHLLLDRKLAAPTLAGLRDATIMATGQATVAVEAALDSLLEGQFLAWLRDNGYWLPERSQVYFAEAACRPDFVYDGACAVVYIDGPYHDHLDRQARDQGKDAAMKAAGYRSIRFGHRDDWAQIVDSYPDVFGRGDEG